MLILGINEGIDASVVLLRDGKVIFAIQEERLRREKGYIGFPSQSVMYCAKLYGLNSRTLECVCFSNLGSPPSESREDLLHYYARSAYSYRQTLRTGDVLHAAARLTGFLPSSIQEFVYAQRLSRRSAVTNPHVARELAGCGLDGVRISRFHHHSNHAASAYYALCKNWDEPHLVFTLDGGGDDACAHVYRAQEGRLRLLAATPNGHSIGNIYACATYMLGMHPHAHEYKVMGLAPYADTANGLSLARWFGRYLDLDPRNPMRFKRRIGERTNAILPRLLRDFQTVRFDRVAAGLQLFTEQLIEKWILATVRQTGIRHVLAAGGVFMNVKANKRIAELPDIQFFDVFPSCGDETLPFGAVWQSYLEQGGRHADIQFRDIFLGPESRDDLAEAQEKYSEVVHFEKCDDPDLRIAELLAGGNIVARCAGRMEFGARALGNRSILADPGNPAVVWEVNRQIKRRDFWMPFAPAILGEKAARYITIPHSLTSPFISPYMMHAFDTTDLRTDLAAALHNADGTARAQLVWRELNPSFYRIIEQFGRLTGRWAVLNTSFNLHGTPIVTGACDALEVFLNSELRYLMIDQWLVTKRQALSPPPVSGDVGRAICQK